MPKKGAQNGDIDSQVLAEIRKYPTNTKYSYYVPSDPNFGKKKKKEKTKSLKTESAVSSNIEKMPE